MLSDVFDLLIPGIGLELRLPAVLCAPYDFSRLGRLIRTMANVLLAASQAHEYLDSRCSCGRELKRVSWQVQNRLAAGPGLAQGSRCVQCGVISIWSEGFTASSSFDDRDSTANDDGCRVRIYKAVITAARLQ